MVLNGRVICNGCRCEIGVVYVRVLRPVHYSTRIARASYIDNVSARANDYRPLLSAFRLRDGG